MITLEEVADLIRREARVMAPDSLAIDENTRLDDLGLSSLQIAEIVFTLEENHDVEFDPVRAAGARTLGDLVALVKETARTQAD